MLIDAARNRGIALEEVALHDLEGLRPPPPLDRALNEIKTQLVKVLPDLEAAQITKIQNRLRNSGKFKKPFPS